MKNEPAFPCEPIKANDRIFERLGLTKREYFAAKAMQALVSNSEAVAIMQEEAEKMGKLGIGMLAAIAVSQADALIAELSKGQGDAKL